MKHSTGYHVDLSSIHDLGFSRFSFEAADGLQKLFKKHPLPENHIVELGCGSGLLAQQLLARGYRVTGIDRSPSMIKLAWRNAPGGEYTVRSLWNYTPPSCGAVLSVGEVLNYQFDGKCSLTRLRTLLRRVYRSLLPSGIFVFDILCSRTGGDLHTRGFTEGVGWCVAVEKTDRSDSLTRRIISFRRHLGVYRRTAELHEVHKYSLAGVRAAMRDIGFKVTAQHGYTERRLEKGHVVLIGTRP
jgi:SAM-dependent methyltransferase